LFFLVDEEEDEPAFCFTRYLTMAKWPSKQAALSGVELVLVVALTLAPFVTSNRTMSMFPAAEAHQSGGAPSIVSPSNVTVIRKEEKTEAR
jgi:hypothetical protein